MRNFVQGDSDHVVQAVRDIPVQPQVPWQVLTESDHHVVFSRPQVCSRKLIGKGHGVLSICKRRAVKAVQHL